MFPQQMYYIGVKLVQYNEYFISTMATDGLVL